MLIRPCSRLIVAVVIAGLAGCSGSTTEPGPDGGADATTATTPDATTPINLDPQITAMRKEIDEMRAAACACFPKLTAPRFATAAACQAELSKMELKTPTAACLKAALRTNPTLGGEFLTCMGLAYEGGEGCFDKCPTIRANCYGITSGFTFGADLAACYRKLDRQPGISQAINACFR